ARDVGGGAGLRRLRLHHGVSGRALLAGRPAHDDHRGHQRDPADHHRAGARVVSDAAAPGGVWHPAGFAVYYTLMRRWAAGGGSGGPSTPPARSACRCSVSPSRWPRWWRLSSSPSDLAVGSSARARQELDDHRRQLLALVLLQEVAGAGDRGVRLALGAGDR